MGFTPQQIDDMSLWQITCAAEGWREAHDHNPKPPAMSDEEFDDIVARLG